MSDHINFIYHNTPAGELILGSYNDKLCLADWRYRKMRTTIDTRIKNHLKAEFLEASSDVIEATIGQLDLYFAKKLKSFSIPLLFAGTDFQQKVWKELRKIPYGETTTYLKLSRSLGDEKAIRAVASANGANAISIIVPCHRIIGSDGSLVGYAGGIQAKRKLLNLERELAGPRDLFS